MATRTPPGAPLDQSEPPFLQEHTVLVEREPERALVDQLLELSYRWRVGLIGGLALTVLAAVVLGSNGDSADPLASSDSSAPVSASSPTTAATASTPPSSSNQAAAPALPSPADSASTTTSSTSTTTPSTTASTTSTTTTTTTTEPQPPTTVVNCLLSVRRTDLRDEPDGERIARVSRGTYAGFQRSDDGDWFLIDYQGTVGWIRDRAVRDIEGDCG